MSNIIHQVDVSTDLFSGKLGVIALVSGLVVGLGLQFLAQKYNAAMSQYLGVSSHAASLLHTLGPLLFAYPLNYLSSRRNLAVKFTGEFLSTVCVAGFFLALFGFIAWFVGWS